MEKAPENRISETELDQLIAAHDGDVALLYLYLRRRGGDLDAAARTLCRTGAAMADAAEKLRRLGLWPESSAPARPLPPPDELPQFTADEIAGRARGDAAFQAVVAETQQVLGRTLSGADLQTLFGIYTTLALPPEVIFELLHFCADRVHEKFGPGQNPSLRAIEKEAYRWADGELLTLEQAEEYIETDKARRQDENRVKTLLGIRDRKLTATEQRYIGEWLALGFAPEALEAAYDRTVTNTGALKWAYMDKIVKSWHGKGLHTLSEIEAGDAPRRGPAPAGPAAGRSNSESLSALKNKIRSPERK